MSAIDKAKGTRAFIVECWVEIQKGHLVGHGAASFCNYRGADFHYGGVTDHMAHGQVCEFCDQHHYGNLEPSGVRQLTLGGMPSRRILGTRTRFNG